MVTVVQLVRASDCGSECRGFESLQSPPKKRKFKMNFLFFYVQGFYVIEVIAPKRKEDM